MSVDLDQRIPVEIWRMALAALCGPPPARCGQGADVGAPYRLVCRAWASLLHPLGGCRLHALEALPGLPLCAAHMQGEIQLCRDIWYQHAQCGENPFWVETTYADMATTLSRRMRARLPFRVQGHIPPRHMYKRMYTEDMPRGAWVEILRGDRWWRCYSAWGRAPFFCHQMWS